MKLFVYIPKVRVCNMSINLSCRDVGVAEHHLHTSYVGAVGEQVCREAVADDVWCHFL